MQLGAAGCSMAASTQLHTAQQQHTVIDAGRHLLVHDECVALRRRHWVGVVQQVLEIRGCWGGVGLPLLLPVARRAGWAAAGVGAVFGASALQWSGGGRRPPART